MPINVLADPFAWFLNLLSCLPFAFIDFIVMCLIASGMIFLVSLWRSV